MPISQRPSAVVMRPMLALAAALLTALIPGRAAPSSAPDPPTAGAGPFGWPLAGAVEVVGEFRPPAEHFGSGHRGIDLASTAGATVASAGPGVVVFAGELAGRGVISIDHPRGLRTTYEPVTPLAGLHPGSVVDAGTPIGTVTGGHRPCAPQVCLHWGLRSETGPEPTYLDPRILLGGGPVRLEPLRAAPASRAKSTGRPP